MQSYGMNQKDFNRNLDHSKLLHFNSSKIRSVWISYKAKNLKNLNENFIKIGIGYPYVENIICEFRTKSNATLHLMREINDVSINDDVHILEKICIEHSVEEDPLPLVNPLLYYDKNYLDPRKLTEDGRKLYGFLTSLDFNIKDEELNSIQYSIDTEGCLLNLKYEENLSNSIIISYSSNEYFTSFLELLPSGHHKKMHDYNTTVLTKILNGEVDYQWYNPLDEGLLNQVKNKSVKKGDITWATHNYYQTHEITNFHSDIAILFKIQPKNDYSNMMNIVSYEQLILTTAKEYKDKICDKNLKKCNCFFDGFQCGISLKSFSCFNSIESHGIYSCNKASGIPKLYKKCSHKCILNKKSAICKDKPHVFAKILSLSESNTVFGSLEIEDTENSMLFINGVLFGLKENLNYIITIHEKSDDDENYCENIKSPFDPLNIGTSDIGKLRVNEYGVAYIKNFNKSFLNTKTSNLFNILNRIIAIRIDANEPIVACGKIVNISPLNLPNGNNNEIEGKIKKFFIKLHTIEFIYFLQLIYQNMRNLIIFNF